MLPKYQFLKTKHQFCLKFPCSSIKFRGHLFLTFIIFSWYELKQIPKIAADEQDSWTATFLKCVYDILGELMPLQKKMDATQKRGRVQQCLWNKRDNNITEISCERGGIMMGYQMVFYQLFFSLNIIWFSGGGGVCLYFLPDWYHWSSYLSVIDNYL